MMYKNKRRSDIGTLQHYCIALSVSHLRKLLQAKNSFCDYQFYVFNEWNVSDFLPESFLHEADDRKCIIIAPRALLPLALFYFKYFPFVVSVFSASESMDAILHFLHYSNGRKLMMPSVSEVPNLTLREVIVLDLTFKHINVGDMSDILGSPRRTVYSQRATVASKMNLKRIGQLFQRL